MWIDKSLDRQSGRSRQSVKGLAMPLRILVINGHPDPRPQRLAAGLTSAYVRGAEAAGHQVRRIDLGSVSFPPVITGDELSDEPPTPIREAQEAIAWCEHLTIIYPLWLAAPPAHLKSFFEQIWRYDFAFDHKQKPLLKGRSARLIVTMIVPAFIFRLLFSQATKGFARGVLWTAGIKPTRILPLGNVYAAKTGRWLAKIEALGARGA